MALLWRERNIVDPFVLILFLSPSPLSGRIVMMPTKLMEMAARQLVAWNSALCAQTERWVWTETPFARRSNRSVVMHSELSTLIPIALKTAMTVRFWSSFVQACRRLPHFSATLSIVQAIASMAMAVTATARWNIHKRDGYAHLEITDTTDF